MPCPHSTAPGTSPSTCSLCLQSHTAFEIKRVAITPEGAMTVNGEHAGRLADINREKQAEETRGHMPRGKKTCGRCGTPGHNRTTCNKPIGAEKPLDEPEFN